MKETIPESNNQVDIISKNIKVLRKYNHETQNELANAIKVAKCYIGHWENGRRIPTEDNLEAVAAHYKITAEILEKEELTQEMLQELSSVFGIKHISKLVISIFPKVTFGLAHRYPEFVLADEEYKKVLYENSSMATMLTSARKHYYNVFKKYDILAAAINTLSVMFMEYLSIDSSQELSRKLLNNNLTRQEAMLFLKEWGENVSEKRKKFILDTEDIFDECVCALRKNPHTIDYAEYFVALKYIFNFVDNEESFKANQTIGISMMLEFVNFENPMAEEFIENSTEL